MARKCVISTISDADAPTEGSQVVFSQPQTAPPLPNGMRSGTAGVAPDQTNMYKADGGIWLILFWMIALDPLSTVDGGEQRDDLHRIKVWGSVFPR